MLSSDLSTGTIDSSSQFKGKISGSENPPQEGEKEYNGRKFTITQSSFNFQSLTTVEISNFNAHELPTIDAPQLTSLSLENCPNLKRIAAKVPHLQKLSLKGCPELEASPLLDFIRSCSPQELTIQGYDFTKFAPFKIEMKPQISFFSFIEYLNPSREAKFEDYSLFRKVPLLMKNQPEQFQGPAFEAIVAFLKSDSSVFLLKSLHINKTNVQTIIQTLSSKSVKHVKFINNQFEDGCFNPVVMAIVANPSIAKITFNDSRLGLEKIKVIADALTSARHIIKVNFRNTAINNKGAGLLFKAIGANQSITHVNVRDNNIYSKGVEAIARAISNNSLLVSLNLENNWIANEGIRQIADSLKEHPSLVQINLGDNVISLKGINHLSLALKQNSSLTTIGLQSNQINDQAILTFAAALKSNPHSKISSVNFANNSISDEGARAIAQVFATKSSPAFVNLRENKIGFRTAEFLIETLATNPSLSIDLRKNYYVEMNEKELKQNWIKKGRNLKDLRIKL